MEVIRLLAHPSIKGQQCLGLIDSPLPPRRGKCPCALWGLGSEYPEGQAVWQRDFLWSGFTKNSRVRHGGDGRYAKKKHRCHFGAGCEGRAAWNERRVSFCIRNDLTPTSVSQDTHIDLIQLYSATPDRTQALLLTQVHLCQEETEKLEFLE